MLLKKDGTPDGRRHNGQKSRNAAIKRRLRDGLWLCTRCHEHKALDQFTHRGGIPVSNCLECCRVMNKRLRETHKPLLAEKAARRRDERKMNRQSELITCERCGKTKPRSEWPVEGSSASCLKNGRVLKYCCSTKVRSYEQVQHDISSQSKDCSSCGERKPFSSFSPNNAAKDGRQTTCKSCRSAKVHSGQWNGNTRRQAQIDERSDGTITPELVMDIFSIKNCPCCDGYMERDDKVMDHIIPLKLNGLHSRDNVMVLCWSCNAGKAARHPKEWLNMLRDDAAQRMRKVYAQMGLNFDE